MLREYDDRAEAPELILKKILFLPVLSREVLKGKRVCYRRVRQELVSAGFRTSGELVLTGMIQLLMRVPAVRFEECVVVQQGKGWVHGRVRLLGEQG